jgi:hypothetical protein
VFFFFLVLYNLLILFKCHVLSVFSKAKGFQGAERLGKQGFLARIENNEQICN